MLVYDIPLAEVIIDFFDSLKNISSGYASMSYEMLDYRADDLVKLDILVAGEMVEALSSIVHKSKAIQRGMELTKRLKELLPKAQFPIALQAAIGSRVIARETIPALRKDVTAKLYGGDVSRKMKLLKKQKEGKKRMKQIGKVHISQEAFLAILKR
jgi:GTP-binding protein LepA